MKPLLSQRVRRGETLREWTSAESHLTLDGLREFAERQRKRAEDARKEAERRANVTQIKRREKA